jgi:2'-5' RNA ligase
MKRIFIAVKVEPEETLMKMLSSFRSVLSRESIKWTNPDNLHITLAFLGNTEDDLITAISGMLSEKCERSGRFELTVRGSGVFKSLKDPRVIWIGIGHSEELQRLNTLIKNGLAGTGIKLEDRPFKPHLTIGRVRQLRSNDILKSMLEKYEDTEFQKVSVNEVILYESMLLRTGSVYNPLRKFNL